MSRHSSYTSRNSGQYAATPQRNNNKPPHKSKTIHSSESYESGYSSSHHRKRSDVSAGSRTSSRTDEDVYAGVKRVLVELNKAIGQERRIAAITNACAEYDHWDTDRHNAELQLGSANVLSLVLSMTEDDDEIRMICSALEMIFRASTEAVRKSFQDVGPAVLPYLLKSLERCENGMMKYADVSILNISKLLLYFSRVPELRVTLAQHEGVLNVMARVVTSNLKLECRVLRMRVAANLANSDSNKLPMVQYPGLLDSILKIAALDMKSESSREYAAACLMDLASSPHTQVPMAGNDKLLGTLVKLAVTDEKDETREYAVTSIQNLAFSKENRLRLVSYSSGVVLEALKKSLSVDLNDKTRRRSAGALTNLACDETADKMASHEGMIDVLAKVTTGDKNNDVQKRSCLALTKIVSSCTFTDAARFDSMMRSLVQASSSPNGTGIAAVLRVKARDTSKRESLARLPGLLEALAKMSTSEDTTHKDKDNAMRAIMHLTNESQNRQLMCNNIILRALVEASHLEGVNNIETRDSAVVAIERLATEVANRQFMARHDGLLVAVANATERESKAELAGEKHTQPRLAKQLLMSLLLAM